MFVKFRDSKSGSQHFSIIKEQQTVLRMDKGVSNNNINIKVKKPLKSILTLIIICFLESTCS